MSAPLRTGERHMSQKLGAAMRAFMPLTTPRQVGLRAHRERRKMSKMVAYLAVVFASSLPANVRNIVVSGPAVF